MPLSHIFIIHTFLYSPPISHQPNTIRVLIPCIQSLLVYNPSCSGDVARPSSKINILLVHIHQIEKHLILHLLLCASVIFSMPLLIFQCHSHQVLHICVVGGVISCYCGISKIATSAIGIDCANITTVS